MRSHPRLTALQAMAAMLASLAPGLLRAEQPDRFAAVAPRMEGFVQKGEISGAVTLVATKNRIIHLAAAGRTDLAHGRKMKTDDIFWIASIRPAGLAGLCRLARCRRSLLRCR